MEPLSMSFPSCPHPPCQGESMFEILLRQHDAIRDLRSYLISANAEIQALKSSVRELQSTARDQAEQIERLKDDARRIHFDKMDLEASYLKIEHQMRKLARLENQAD